MPGLIDEERQHRLGLWARVRDVGGPKGVAPDELRKLRIYYGAQGIWVDKTRTGRLTSDERGVTVGLLHTGKAYADDLSEGGVRYHYPKTGRPPGRDLAEVDATKAAGRLRLPVFVVTHPTPNSSTRDVHLGWVESWDDESAVFLVTFGNQPPSRPLNEEVGDEEPFELTEPKKGARREVTAREGQHRFAFDVFKRYGPRCAVCGSAIPEVLDAAHIRPRYEDGSMDPRNGLVLCSNHHRALDAGLFAIHPATLQIHCRPAGPGAQALGITCPAVTHLRKKPHKDALGWLWGQWTGAA